MSKPVCVALGALGAVTAMSHSAEAQVRLPAHMRDAPEPVTAYVLDKGEDATQSFATYVNGAVKELDVQIVGLCPENTRTLERIEGTHLSALDAHMTKEFEQFEMVDIIRERYRAEGCDQPNITHNVFVYLVPTASEIAQISIGLPGETRTVAGFQEDYLRQVAIAAKVLGHDCSDANPDFAVVNTTLIGATDPETYIQAAGGATLGDSELVETWAERWTLRTCAGDQDLDVTLAADADGGVFAAVTLP